MSFYVVTLSLLLSISFAVSSHQFAIDGTVLELDESNFDSAVSAFDFIFVDFYAPWCGHCKRLNPELDAAAPVLAGLKKPIIIAKVNADKYTRLASKYDVDGYPTLKLFMHGIPVEYNGPRKADLLIRYLKKFVALDVAVLDSDSAITNFVEEAGTNFPIFIGFGLNESMIAELSSKYKKQAWFSVAKDFSEKVMVSYDFDKFPALVALHPGYDGRSVFYGPFEEDFLEDFLKQNFLPLAVPINYDTLKLLKNDERKIVLTILDDEDDEKSKYLKQLLEAAASANRDFIFAYVGVKQFEDFADTFGANRKTKLPKMVVWDGNEEYISVIGSESIDEGDEGSQITRFLEGFREGRIIVKGIGGPSLLGYINSLIGIRSVYIIVFVIAMIFLIQTINKEEPLRVGTRDASDAAASSASTESREHRSDYKED